ncbi:MAG: PhoH family protein [Clostridiales bacterium]|nr:PhoH family protein [Clostridiales bacterium]
MSEGGIELKLPLTDNGQAGNLLGDQDKNLRLLEAALKAKIVVRGDSVIINGDAKDVEEARQVLSHLITLSAGGVYISPMAINYALSAKGNADEALAQKLTETVYTTPKGKQIRPKTIGQWYYLQSIRSNDLTFGIGVAGTGKTYLAVVMAVAALKQRQISKIVLARPAVEAGEKLGFLPGDLQDKVNPYLRPVHDALYDVLGQETAQKYMERNTIEVVPLAYMRGRTLEDSFIILDEAQNTTSPQMKMFLTRLGLGSKAVITGDITQIDLPSGQVSGLIEAERRLRDIEEISFCYFTRVDVVRHPLVQKIIDAYERKWV